MLGTSLNRSSGVGRKSLKNWLHIHSKFGVSLPNIGTRMLVKYTVNGAFHDFRRDIFLAN